MRLFPQVVSDIRRIQRALADCFVQNVVGEVSGVAFHERFVSGVEEGDVFITARSFSGDLALYVMPPFVHHGVCYLRALGHARQGVNETDTAGRSRIRRPGYGFVDRHLISGCQAADSPRQVDTFYEADRLLPVGHFPLDIVVTFRHLCSRRGNNYGQIRDLEKVFRLAQRQ
ncbi:MAG: hypothetical protein ACRDQZ_03490 [Mycobacteriales bacterium]